jgi:beta-lactamase class A
VRALLAGLVLVLAACSQAGSPAAAPTPTPAPPGFAALEQRHDARLGVFAVDTGDGRTVAHRADERFAHASSFKALLVAAVLERTDDLDRAVSYGPQDIVTFSPATRRRTSLTLRELAAAAVQVSDNTAANLLLRELGGPAALQAALRRAGDATTRTDRLEPDLNEATPGDPRDTTTPRALATTLRTYLLDGRLDAGDRDLLEQWMRDSTTGGTLVRAGVPEGWQVADKSGSGGYGTRNDVAVVRPPGRAPIVIAVMSSRSEQAAPQVDALLADATRAVVAVLP